MKPNKLLMRPLKTRITIAVIAALAALTLLGVGWTTQNSIAFLSCKEGRLSSRQGGSNEADFASDGSRKDGPDHKEETSKPPLPSFDDSHNKSDSLPKYMVPGQQHAVCSMNDTELQQVLSMPHDKHAWGKRYFFNGNWMTILEVRRVAKNLTETDGCVVVHVRGQMPCAGVPDGCILHFHVRLNESDLSVVLQLLENVEMRGLDRTIKYDSILDAGGNIGIAAVLFAVQYPMARIVSVEPASGNFKLLRKNIEPFLNVLALRGGVWPQTKSLEVYDVHKGEWGITVREVSQAKNEGDTFKGSLTGLTIPLIAEISDIKSFDLIKIDIEGSEIEVFGETADLSYLQNARTVLVETHDRFRPESTETVKKAFGPNFVTSKSGEYTVFNRQSRKRALT